jgi:hypothetical protein
VLIIDAADLIAKDNPSFFRKLQDFAKAGADKGTIRLVFVSIEGVALPLLHSNSAWSRARQPYEIGDISDSQAIDYLVRCNVPADRATNAVTAITAGRFALLTEFEDAFSIKSNEQWRDELYDRLLSSLKKLQIDPKNAAFKFLGLNLRAKESTILEHLNSIQIESLLRANVLSFHPDERILFTLGMWSNFLSLKRE